MSHHFQIFRQSDYLIQIVDINSHTEWQTVQIQISWLLQKPTDLDLHCLQRQCISGFCRTRVKVNTVHTLTIYCIDLKYWDTLSTFHTCPKTWNTSFCNLHLFSILIPHMKFQIQNLSAKCVKQRDGWLYEQPKLSLRSTYQNHISETHKVNIHKGKIRNVQTDRHGPKINGV